AKGNTPGRRRGRAKRGGSAAQPSGMSGTSDRLRGRQGYAPQAGAVNDRRRSLPLRRRAPTLGRLGDAEDLAEGRRHFRFGPAQPEVAEDAADGEGVGDEGDHAHTLVAADAEEGVHLVNLGDQPRPAWRAALA